MSIYAVMSDYLIILFSRKVILKEGKWVVGEKSWDLWEKKAFAYPPICLGNYCSIIIQKATNISFVHIGTKSQQEF